MGQFSDDGRWWWDGRTWVATAQIVLPQLPITEFERSGRLARARADLANGRRAFWSWVVLLGGNIPGLMPVNRRGFREYRTWTIEQLALATDLLLGPGETMVAGEVSSYDYWDNWTRNLAVAVTAAHVIVFRIDHRDGQPRWIAMAARMTDVTMERVTVLFGLMYQALRVTGPTGRWDILGFQAHKFDPQPVIDAWRKGVGAVAGA